MKEEMKEVPAGYAMAGQNKMITSNTQLPRIGRQESMFRQGQGFQPAPGGAGLGQVRLRGQGDPLERPSPVGQLPPSQISMAQTPAKPPVTIPVTQPASVQPPPASDKAHNEQNVLRHPAMRLSWGRLKKKDAGELADALTDVIARMRAKGIPPGMVAQIQARLANFEENGQENQDIEITEHEVQRMEAEILALEEAEAAAPSDGSPNWLIAVGAAIGLGLLIDAIS